jgi:hypothetical protein
MDNYRQIIEIKKYKQYLSRIIGKEIKNNIAAAIWIRKYSKIWRMRHQQIRQISVQL